MYNRNGNGPKIVPWGTPQLNKQLLESDPLMEHTFEYDSLNIDVHISDLNVLGAVWVWLG